MVRRMFTCECGYNGNDLDHACFKSGKVNLIKEGIMKYFEYSHLPEKLQAVSVPICDVAHWYDENIPNGPEKVEGLRKLLEAKDCMVRAAL